MRFRPLLALLLVAGAAAPLRAQATRDQARLVITVGPTATLGQDLWSVGAQPISTALGEQDTLRLGREIKSSIGFLAQVAYFPGDNWGASAEAQLLGVGFRDTCSVTSTISAQDTRLACDALDGGEKAATGVLLSLGGIYRVNSRKIVSPYARLHAGVLFTQQSSIRTIGTFTRPDGSGPVDLIVYDDAAESRANVGLLVGLGFTAQLAPGYALRWELRDNIVGVQTVDGATARQQLEPEHSMSFKHLPSMLVGFDVVLERRRGRRY